MTSVGMTAAVGAVLIALATPALSRETSTPHRTMHHHHHHHSAHTYHRCHGMSAGTAHHSCGTRTGGPVGGLH